jgi:hypothetical protein
MGGLGMEKVESAVPKRRSQAEKVGKHKYEIALLHRIEGRLDRIEQMFHIVFHGLGDRLQFKRPLVEEIACQSDMDLAIISLIFESGPDGILAKDIQARLPQLNLEKHRILRIVKRINRSIEDAFGRRLIEKRGKKWAFTDFGVEIWGETEEEMKGRVTEPLADET